MHILRELKKQQMHYSNALAEVIDKVKYLTALIQIQKSDHDVSHRVYKYTGISIIKKIIKWFLKLLIRIGRRLPKKLFKNPFSFIFLKAASAILSLLIAKIQKRMKGRYNIYDDKKFESIAFLKEEKPLVSVIIPVHNQYRYTMRCLYSIAETVKDVKYEIILTDDNSTDETKKIIEKVKHITYIRNEPALGFLRNCNAAAKKARGQYLVFLNNDTVVQPQWLESMLAIFERNPLAGMVGSKLVYPEGILQEAGGIIWDDASGWNFGKFQQPDEAMFNYVKPCDYISGASIMISTKLWEEIGGFDDRYAPAYFEDSDLAFAVRKKGYETIYQPQSVVVHFEGVTHGKNITKGVKRHQEINKQTFIEKWGKELQEQFQSGEDVFLARDRSRNKKCIVVIDHYVPEPDKDAGSKTVFQYLQLFIEQGLNVKFIGDNYMNKEPYTSALQQMGIEVLYGLWYAETWRKWLTENDKYIDYFFINRPHIASKYMPFIREHCRGKIIFYGHDLHYLREERQATLEQKKQLLLEAAQSKEKEYSLFSIADLILYPSYTEINEIKSNNPDLPVTVMPPYFFEPVTSEYVAADRKDLLFVGGFNHPPNVDAVIWFIKEIYPLVRKEIPDIVFHVVGSNAPEQITKLSSKQIVVHGFVSEQKLNQLYLACKMVVVPLRYGAGIKGKVVEALSFGVPMVSTSIGIEGLNNNDEAFLCADTPAAFASSIVNAYQNRSHLESISKRAKSLIQHYFSKQSAKDFIKHEMLR